MKLNRQKLFVLVPVEIETYVDDSGDTVVGCITHPTKDDVEKAMVECNTFMGKEDAWDALTR